MSWPHPSALCQQQRILAGQSRFPPARSREEDNSSVLSWNTAQNESDDPADGEDPLLAISEAPGASQSATTAPALQAARNFVDHTNETGLGSIPGRCLLIQPAGSHRLVAMSSRRGPPRCKRVSVQPGGSMSLNAKQKENKMGGGRP